jgi:hypothetical protein
MAMMAACRVGLQPTLMANTEQKEQFCSLIKHFFHRITSVSLYITGSKIDIINRVFYLFFARMRVSFDLKKIEKPEEEDEVEVDEHKSQESSSDHDEEEDETPQAAFSDESSSSSNLSDEESDHNDPNDDAEEEKVAEINTTS